MSFYVLSKLIKEEFSVKTSKSSSWNTVLDANVEFFLGNISRDFGKSEEVCT